jgi:uncharacterized phage protein (TIGR01671 family)
VYDGNNDRMISHERVLLDFASYLRLCQEDHHYVFMDNIGVKDKNDNPVYEGDIIDLHQTVNGCNLFVVEWGKIGWTVRYGIKMITPRTYEYSVEDLFKPCQFSGEVDYEVIGNIYQHDHLLRNE